MTRQRKYQLRHASEGKCVLCPRKASPQNRKLCPEHREKANQRRREYRVKKAKDASMEKLMKAKKWGDVLPPEMLRLIGG